MKKPVRPPAYVDLLAEAMADTERFGRIFATPLAPLINGKYLHWDKLICHTPPSGLSHREWWLALKVQRRGAAKAVPLADVQGARFTFTLTDPIPERLHDIDLRAGGHVQMPEQVTSPETRDRYYVGSLIEEAITSSQLEGATTTRQVAKEMLRAGRAPRDRSERMILNNFLTMQHIGKIKDKPLTKDLVLAIHEQVTHDTWTGTPAAGRLRRADEEVVVADDYGEVYHTPPHAEELEERLSVMCRFANGEIPDYFIHPAIRSILLHFWLAYDHPFVDGNGRTARALFYWSMLHHGYWLFEFLSISQIIIRAPARYERAFLYTETDDNDLTYFILYHLEVIRKAVEQLHEYIRRKSEQLRELEAELRGSPVLNHRQRALISHALRHPGHRYTIQSHQTSHNVVYETARTDLLDLVERGLLVKQKSGRTYYFVSAADIERKLAQQR